MSVRVCACVRVCVRERRGGRNGGRVKKTGTHRRGLTVQTTPRSCPATALSHCPETRGLAPSCHHLHHRRVPCRCQSCLRWHFAVAVVIPQRLHPRTWCTHERSTQTVLERQMATGAQLGRNGARAEGERSRDRDSRARGRRGERREHPPVCELSSNDSAGPRDGSADVARLPPFGTAAVLAPGSFTAAVPPPPPPPPPLPPLPTRLRALCAPARCIWPSTASKPRTMKESASGECGDALSAHGRFSRDRRPVSASRPDAVHGRMAPPPATSFAAPTLTATKGCSSSDDTSGRLSGSRWKHRPRKDLACNQRQGQTEQDK